MNRKAAILGRHPRTKLTDLREQSECLVVTLSFSPKEQRNTGPRTRRAETSTTTADTTPDTTITTAAATGWYSSSSDWFDKNLDDRANHNNPQQTPSTYRTHGVVGADINNISDPIADEGGASFVRGFPPQEEEEEGDQVPPVPTAAATVCVVGTRAAVDSAGVLLGVILDYMRRERKIQEGGVAVRERLLVRPLPPKTELRGLLYCIYIVKVSLMNPVHRKFFRISNVETGPFFF